MDIIYRLIHDRRHQAEVSSQVETNGQLSSRKVAAPWGLGELYAYQVWAELSKECLHHAELWMACTLTKEAERHAKVYGDGRTLRDLAVTKARIAMEEGNHSEAVRILRELSAADLGQCSEAAVLLANAYEARKQPFPAQEIFKEALAAINQSPGTKAAVKKPKAHRDLGWDHFWCSSRFPMMHDRYDGHHHTTATYGHLQVLGSIGGSTFKGGSEINMPSFSSKHVLAQCCISTRQLHSELERLRKSQARFQHVDPRLGLLAETRWLELVFLARFQPDLAERMLVRPQLFSFWSLFTYFRILILNKP